MILSATRTIYFDESGFTGEDLINAEQRHFTLASTTIDDTEAEAILRDCFPRYAAAEFKSKTLWRGTRYRHGLLRFSAALRALSDRTFTYVIDKRFSLLIKLVDYLVEPMVWQSGRDFYRDAYSRKFVNTINADLRDLGPPGLYDETAAVWNRMARTPTPQTLADLQTFLADKAAVLRLPLSSFFKLAAQGADEFVDPGERIEDFRDSNDLLVTAMLSSVQHWRTQTDKPLILVHDESRAFTQRRDMWDALVSDDATPFTAEAAGGRIAFPLGVAATRPELSERSAAIQLCDVLAGMFAKALRSIGGGTVDPFLVDLMRAGLGDAPFDGVMPSGERVTGPPPLRQGPDLLDSMADVLRPAIDEIIRSRGDAGTAGDNDSPRAPT